MSDRCVRWPATAALIFAAIFGAIGFGALSLLLDSSAPSSTKVFGAVFGGVFALVGIVGRVGAARVGAFTSLRQSLRPRQVRYGKTKTQRAELADVRAEPA